MALDLSQLPPAKQEIILNGQALPTPPGAEQTFDNPPNQNLVPEAIIPICLIFVTTAILLRAYSRVFILKKVRIDDGLIVLAFLCFIGYIYCVYRVTYEYGFFVHQWNIRVRDISKIQHILHIASNFYVPSLLCGKSAILLQWIQIFSPEGTRGFLYWTCHTVMWINLLYYLSTGVAGNLICVPFERIWDKRIPGVCYNGKPLNFSIGIFNLISDVIILVLPQRAIWGLNMPTSRKFGIALIFAFGLIACAAAALRIGLTFYYLTDRDWLFRVAGLSMSCIAEMTCIILVHCLPGVPSAFRDSGLPGKFVRSFRSSLQSVSSRLGTGSVSTGTASDFTRESRQKGYHEMSLTEISLNKSQRAGAQDRESIERLQPKPLHGEV